MSDVTIASVVIDDETATVLEHTAAMSYVPIVSVDVIDGDFATVLEHTEVMSNVTIASVVIDDETSTVLEHTCLLYTSPSPRDPKTSRMPSSA